MNRFEDEIKAAFEAPKPKRKEEFINMVSPSKMSVGRFLLTQMGYIRKSTWVIFAIILACIVVSPFVLDYATLWFISALMPILAMSLVTESARSERYNMAEIEAATRFSLRSVIMARMVILGGINLIAILIATPIGIKNCGFETLTSGLYVVTPFFLTSSIGLSIVRKIKGQAGFYAVMAEAFVISMVMLLDKSAALGTFTTGATKLWSIVTVVAIAATIKQGIGMINSTEDITWSW
ncbi:MAG: hypothetical protein J5811_07110 [Lachnospiraceae bacterium]|nr:hypothetical protein [Lachnospiraceae bacterium]